MATGELAAAFEASGSVSRHGPKGLVASSLPALAHTVGLQVSQLCIIFDFPKHILNKRFYWIEVTQVSSEAYQRPELLCDVQIRGPSYAKWWKLGSEGFRIDSEPESHSQQIWKFGQ